MSEIQPRYQSKSAKQALAHLIEEMGEALAAAGKTLRWGPHSYNPELQRSEQEYNIDWLTRELDDVVRAEMAFRILAAHEGWSPPRDDTARNLDGTPYAPGISGQGSPDPTGEPQT